MLNSDISSPADYPLSPPPPLFLELLHVTCISSILLPPGPARLSLAAFIFVLFFHLVFWVRYPSRDAYLLGVSSTILVYRWLDLVVIHQPETDFWRVTGGESGFQRCPEGRWKRCQWFFWLWNAQRGVGYNIQPPSLPPAPPSAVSRSSFLQTTFFQSLAMYIRLDIVQNISKHTFALFPSIEFFDFPFKVQVSLAWVLAFKLHHTISLIYFLASFVCVLFKIYTPQDWPPIFGNFVRDAYTIRKMWGICWHQMMRRPCSEAGRIVKELCGFRTGGFMSRYSQLWVGFAVSTSVHHVGAVMGMFADGGYWQAMYFGIQSVGIMFEDGVVAAGKKLGVQESDLTRSLGFLWVFVWFSWTLRWMVAFNPLSWVEDFGVPSAIEYTLINFVTKS